MTARLSCEEALGIAGMHDMIEGLTHSIYQEGGPKGPPGGPAAMTLSPSSLLSTESLF